METENIKLLKEGALEYGIKLSENQLNLFAIFLERLCFWNRKINLTSISGQRDMVLKLFLDSLSALPHLPPIGAVLDIGSGAGIPGLPLKIARPEFEIHLLDSKAKKISFLRDTIRKLELKNIKAYQGRAEQKFDLPSGLRPFYDIVTARALTSLKETIKISYPFIAPNGLLVTYKGSKVEQEIKESETIMEELCLKISKTVLYLLPEIDGERCLLILKRKEG